MADEEIVSFVTDMTYGLLIIGSVALALITGYWGPVVGLMIGICLGYIVHVGSQMAELDTTVADGTDD